MASDSKTIQPLSLRKALLCLLLTIGLVILVTELIEAYFRASEFVEGVTHVLVLSGLLAPLFYYFWYKPLNRQVARAQASEQSVRELSHRLMKASELERRTLASDLHDVLGQKITSLQIHIDRLQQALNETQIALPDLCRPLTREVNSLGDDLRSVLADLRPATLEDLGLIPALESLCRKIAADHPELTVDFRAGGIRDRLEQSLEIVLYRACQEALTNILKHSNACRAEVSLFRSHPKIILTVEDDGGGPPDRERLGEAKNQAGNFGLVGMRERVVSVGGHLWLIPKPGGLRIRIEVPEKLTGVEKWS